VDRILPLELICHISQYLPAEDYLRFQRCGSRTLGRKSLIAEIFEEYQRLTEKYNDVFQNRLVATLEDDHIHIDSFMILVTKSHQLEFIRILECKHAYKLNAEVVGDIMNLITGDAYRKECTEIVLNLLISRKIGPNHNFKQFGDSILHCASYMNRTSVVQQLLADADLIVDK
jgi:N12 class adenine-specific DNA methylase